MPECDGSWNPILYPHRSLPQDMPEMSSPTQSVQGPEPQPVPVQPVPAIPVKRPADDDEVEFISSCPVKKPRLNDQKPNPEVSQPKPQNNQVQSRQASVNHHCASSQPLQPDSTIITTNASSDRCQSMQAPSQNSRTLDLALENRGTSLPALESFAFPQDFPPITCPPRMSVAISPKQTPQATPSANHPAPLLANTNVLSNCNPPPGLDQVPCLDFNGIATNSAGFEMGHVFSPPDNSVLMNNSTVMPSQMMNPTLFGPNAIPFTMYSMGNIVPMPQQNMNPSPNTWMNPRSMQRQTPQIFRQNTMPMPVKQQQQLQQTFMPTAPQVAPVRPRCSFSAHSPSRNQSLGKPPCLHCAVLRQEHIRRHQQHPPPPPPPSHNFQPPHHQLHMSLPFTTQTFQPAPPPPPPPTPRAPTPTSEQHTPTNNKRKFSIPLRKKPTQNLLVDIAETAEESFPYDEVAARHGVTPQKVFDTLSAIVLIPLLRCPTDKRRAGKLAHERVKQLAQLKNDMGKEKGEVGTVKEMRGFLGGAGGGE